MSEKLFICECGKTFTKAQSFNGHKSSCKIHLEAKYGNIDEYWKNKHRNHEASVIKQKEKFKKLKEEKLNQWISEQHTCEKCGRIMTEKFGSGRFCSRQCSNSRQITEESNERRRLAVKNTLAYSNGVIVKYFKENEIPPEGFIRCNFSNVKNYSTIEEYAEHLKLKELKSEKNNRSKDFYLKQCKNYIDEHNTNVLNQYEELLHNKSINKKFEVSNTFVFAKYLSVSDVNHPRQHQGHVFVHILLAEKLLDRFLSKEEIVHHKDLDKLHNTFDNIYIFNNKASHARFHNSTCYWLTIKEDVLICDDLTKDKLKEIYESLVVS